MNMETSQERDQLSQALYKSAAAMPEHSMYRGFSSARNIVRLKELRGSVNGRSIGVIDLEKENPFDRGCAGRGVFKYGDQLYYFVTGCFPSMCGGIIMSIHPSDCVPGNVYRTIVYGGSLHNVIYNSSWAHFSGSSMEEEMYDEETDEYYSEEGGGVEGPLGQFVIKLGHGFQYKDARDIIKVLWNHYTKFVREYPCGDYDTAPAVVRQHWLSTSAVGFFTEYNQVVPGRDDRESIRDEHDIRRSLAQDVRDYWGDGSADEYGTRGKFNIESTCSEDLVAITYPRITSFRRSCTLASSVEEFWHNQLAHCVSLMLALDKDVVITDNTTGDYGCLRTSDIIRWLCDNRDYVIKTLKELNGCYAMGSRTGTTSRYDEFYVREFAPANNPNEGAHPIVGVCISRSNVCSYSERINAVRAQELNSDDPKVVVEV